jgi:2-polyprenyl-3-methyl-5-hydroxy-6-metoxy-1,4-benzoquinol methylase
MEQITEKYKCPNCASDNYKKIKEFNNGVVVGKCEQCNLFYTPIRDSKPYQLFAQNPYEKTRFLYEPILQGKVKHFRNTNFKQYLKIINKYSKGKKMLDVGCAHGFFTKMAQENGYVVTAIEPDENMCNFAIKELALNVKHGVFDSVNLDAEKWDVVSFTDSYEYFIEPKQTIKKIESEHLNKNGILFIKVPNGDYFYFRHKLKSKFKIGFGDAEAFSPSKRLAHYTKKTLENIVKNANLEVVKSSFIAPVNSPAWMKHTGLWLEYEAPFCLEWKQKILRNFLHFTGKIEYFLFRKNHFSQSIYIVAKKKD